MSNSKTIKITTEPMDNKQQTADNANNGTNSEPAAVTETDWKAQSRKWEDRAKASNAKADELTAKLNGMTDYADIKAERDALTAKVAELTAAAERSKMVSDVSTKTGVALDIVSSLSGTTLEQLTEQATRIADARTGYPERTDDGGAAVGARRSTADQFADALNQALNS